MFTDRSLPLEPSHLPRRFLQGVLVPVNASARSYHPVLGADVDVFERGYADAAGEAEALAGCGYRGAT